MTALPSAHAHAGPGAWLPVAALAAVAGGYLLLAARRRRAGRAWSRRRSRSFLTGCALLAWATGPDLLPFAESDFRGHMLQHLLIGMLAPLALALAAPITLLLGTLPTSWGRRLGRALRSRPARLLAHPVTALLLTAGGLIALYATPLYALTATTPWAHHLVHVHFLAAGYLFAWVIAGVDPAPHPPSVPFRLVVLGAAITTHAVLSQLMYAGLFIDLPVPAEQRRGGAELMYYGGDIAELLLALALLATWRPRRPRPEQHRSNSPAGESITPAFPRASAPGPPQ
ncbi:cytochrome c oxidase assembly protein [Planomonospora sp. ID67723]|uniref:cytochrome c oxidase assembly protein n=1 Tax=Planomonospora sp. ID67723 TaxID=2738134 RepID=UPI001A293598|nr:cytochrome c oxidase assembly protein [Planomonospora sp. ID67723]MBG0831845.1 cytochrome c oxidase assembly protein [Planomonospora sp. ID67723]